MQEESIYEFSLSCDASLGKKSQNSIILWITTFFNYKN